MSKGLVILGSLRLEGVVNSSFEVNSKAETFLFYSPICLEEVFSDTQSIGSCFFES